MNTKFQNNLIFVFITALIVAALVAHTLLVPVAMIAGWVAAMIVGLVHKLKTKDERFKAMSTWTVSGIDAVLATIGSQIAWVALLI